MRMHVESHGFLTSARSWLASVTVFPLRTISKKRHRNAGITPDRVFARDSYHELKYSAGSWDSDRRVVSGVARHQGKLFVRLGEDAAALIGTTNGTAAQQESCSSLAIWGDRSHSWPNHEARRVGWSEAHSARLVAGRTETRPRGSSVDEPIARIHHACRSAHADWTSRPTAFC